MRNRICLGLMISLALAVGHTLAATSVGGIIATDTLWELAGSPYELVDRAQVAYGVTLTIEPGVQVNGYDLALQIFGQLVAVGTSETPISLDHVQIQPGTYSPTQFFQMHLEHVVIEGGSLYPAISNGGHGSLILRDSVLRRTPYLFLWYPKADSHIERNIFVDAGGLSVGHQWDIKVFIRNNVFYQPTGDHGTPYAVQNWASYDTSETLVEFNSFLSTDRVAVMLPPGYTSSRMRAVNNYWGTTDRATIESMIYDKADDLSCAEYIPYEPFLTEPHPDTPPFQPPTLAVRPSRVNFGAVRVTRCKTKGLQLANEGDAELRITGLDVTPEPPFSLADALQLPIMLTPRSWGRVSLEFCPSRTGKQTGTVAVVSDDLASPLVSIPLRGKGKR